MSQKRILFLVSGPSGVGKTTVVKRLLEQVPGLAKVVTTTSRPRRVVEQDGVDYNFVDKQTFMDMVERDEFIEWKEHFGAHYGLTKAALQQRSDSDLIVDVDTRGKRDIVERVPRRVVTIFLTLPTLEDIEARQKGRGLLSDAELASRLAKAKVEMPTAGEYDHAVQNIDLDETVKNLSRIIREERLRYLSPSSTRSSDS